MIRMLSVMDLLPEFFRGVTGLQWDDGNLEKTWRRHEVPRAEAEQIFLNRLLVVADDPGHSIAEPRFFALGQTDANRPLAVEFTLRGSLVRVISARPMSRGKKGIQAQAQGAETDPTL